MYAYNVNVTFILHTPYCQIHPPSHTIRCLSTHWLNTCAVAFNFVANAMISTSVPHVPSLALLLVLEWSAILGQTRLIVSRLFRRRAWSF